MALSLGPCTWRVSIEPMWSLPYSGCLGITTDLSTVEVIVVRREIYLIGGCRGEDESVPATSLLLLSVFLMSTLLKDRLYHSASAVCKG